MLFTIQRRVVLVFYIKLSARKANKLIFTHAKQTAEQKIEFLFTIQISWEAPRNFVYDYQMFLFFLNIIANNRPVQHPPK